MNNSKKSLKASNGITLIALVITIIVLLILAGISISMLSGDNSILQKATEAKEKTERAEIIENARLDIMSEITDNKGGNITKEKLATVLNKYFKTLAASSIPDEISSTNDIELITSDDKYKIYLSEIYTGKLITKEKYIFNENTFKIEKSINANKYGYKVNTYISSEASGYEGIWRLFYQDENLTYIISDEQIGNYNLNNLYNNYSNGGSVSRIGINLNSKIKDLFNIDNNNPNIKGIAFFTDSELWNKYKDGNDAIFAIGSPTLELYIASYNAAASENINQDRTKLQEAQHDEYGYTSQYSDLNIENYNHGIYSKACWIASPFSVGNSSDVYYFCNIGGGISINSSYPPFMTSLSVRPIVCINTEDFQKKYTLTDE